MTGAPFSAKAELLLTRTFDAPRELVFNAWTDPKHLAQWWVRADSRPRFARWMSGPVVCGATLCAGRMETIIHSMVCIWRS